MLIWALSYVAFSSKEPKRFSTTKNHDLSVYLVVVKFNQQIDFLKLIFHFVILKS
jgi:hypothetical protein